MQPKVFISTSSFGANDPLPLRLLEAEGIAYELNPFGRKLTREEIARLIGSVDGLIAGTEPLDRDVLNGAPRLRVISRCGTGMDNVDLQAAREKGIEVFNTPSAHVDAVAELTLSGILNVLRHVSRADRQIRSREWSKPMGFLLRGRTLGLIGLGRVGQRLVELLRPFDVKLLAVDPIHNSAFTASHGVHYCELPELLGSADIVSLHLGYSPSARHLLNRQRLGQMKEGAVVVNTARGGLIDEEALSEMLLNGRISGAFLDTFETEPYVGPLIDLPNVLLTPHIGSYAAEARQEMEVEAVNNLVAFFARSRKSA